MPSITEDELGRLHALVDHLGYDLDPSILIGGWATHLRVGGDISLDIDLIINSPALRTKLREVLDDYSENTIHSGGRKVRGNVNGIHVDAYIPHESALGNKLRLQVDKLANYTEPEVVKGWLLLTLDAHLVTKFAALLDRADTEKGQKDAREIVALMKAGADAEKAIAVLVDTTDGPVGDVPAHIHSVFELLPDRAKLNKRERRELASKKREWVDEAERQVRRRQSPASTQPPTLQGRVPAGTSRGGQFSTKSNTPPEQTLKK